MAFGKKKSSPVTSNVSNSTLKRDISVKGDLFVGAPIYIDCRIEGKVTGKQDSANITVGAGGEIIGDVQGSNIEVYGSIEGNIDCTSIKIHAKARVKGNIFYQMIEMEPNSHVEGEVHNRVRQKQPVPSSNMVISEKKKRNK